MLRRGVRKTRKSVIEMQILISYENSHRAYRDIIASAIGELRPHVEVALAPLEAVQAEIVRLDPQLVISSSPKLADSNHRPAWVELSLEPDQVSRICVSGRVWES